MIALSPFQLCKAVSITGLDLADQNLTSCTNDARVNPLHHLACFFAHILRPILQFVLTRNFLLIDKYSALPTCFKIIRQSSKYN